MYVVIPYDDIYGGMEFYPARLCSGKVPLVIVVMDMVILDDGKYTSEVSDYAGLSAVMYVAVPDDLRAYSLPALSGMLCVER